MANHKCSSCPIRAKYDKNPSSLMGRFWHWHIGFCPGWKAYFNSLNEEQKSALRTQYNIKK